jgi:hypothetical protein
MIDKDNWKGEEEVGFMAGGMKSIVSWLVCCRDGIGDVE